jgi:hypothetical protein
MSVIIRSATGPCQQITTTSNGYPWQDGDVLDAADLSAAFLGAYNNVGRNLIHNPMFNIAQRGAGPFTVSDVWTLDRWRLSWDTDTNSISQATFAEAQRTQTGDEAAVYSLNNTFTGNAAATAYSLSSQAIESVRRLAGKTVTLSFWAACGAGALNLGVSIDQKMGSGGSPSADNNAAGVAITLSTTWTRYSATFALASLAGKTFGTAGNDNTSLNFWYSSGANQATRAGGIGVQSGLIGIWGVQLEIGTVATSLEKPDPRYDLSNCQRFYETGGASAYQVASGSGQGLACWVNYAVPKRASATVIFSGTAYLNGNSVTANGPGTNGFGLQWTTGGAGATGLGTQWQASADL